MLTTLITTTLGKWAIGTLITVIIGWIFKKIPNDFLAPKVEKFFYGIGFILTGWAAKKAPKLWNTVFEPWVIDFIKNTIGASVNGFIRGLRADNPK